MTLYLLRRFIYNYMDRLTVGDKPSKIESPSLEKRGFHAEIGNYKFQIPVDQGSAEYVGNSRGASRDPNSISYSEIKDELANALKDYRRELDQAIPNTNDSHRNFEILGYEKASGIYHGIDTQAAGMKRPKRGNLDTTLYLEVRCLVQSRDATPGQRPETFYVPVPDALKPNLTLPVDKALKHWYLKDTHQTRTIKTQMANDLAKQYPGCEITVRLVGHEPSSKAGMWNDNDDETSVRGDSYGGHIFAEVTVTPDKFVRAQETQATSQLNEGKERSATKRNAEQDLESLRTICKGFRVGIISDNAKEIVPRLRNVLGIKPGEIPAPIPVTASQAEKHLWNIKSVLGRFAPGFFGGNASEIYATIAHELGLIKAD